VTQAVILTDREESVKTFRTAVFALVCAAGAFAIPALCQTDTPSAAGGVSLNGARIRETLTIKVKMSEIEKRTREEDEEIKNLWDQLMLLHRQYEEKMNAKLASNVEYQELKKRLDALRKQWKEGTGVRKSPEGSSPVGSPPR